MEDDKVTRFIDTRDEQVLEECTKAKLQAVADHFGIKLRSSRLHREEQEREAQLCRKEQEREAQLKQHEIEVRLRQQEIEANKQVELKRAELGLGAPAPPQREDCRVRERDLPVFIPNEAKGFFDHFEKIATLKKWPRAEWAELVQSRLTGEAREAYNMLDLGECTDYDSVKRAVLHSFKLTPECYRKRFRESTRLPGKSYAETARDMERKFLKVKEADIKDLRAAADRADMLEEALRPYREGRRRQPIRSGYGRRYRRTDGWRTGASSPESHLSSGDRRGSKTAVEPVEKSQAESSRVVAETEESMNGARRIHRRRRVRCYNCGIFRHVMRECRHPEQRGNIAFVRVEDPMAEWVRDEPVLSGEKRVHPFVCQGTETLRTPVLNTS
ncbi:uncharacterized protein [Procambarus clarkii]|uniref:uncharacterized protein n=1 Tax=Procambarus clarkii TaxID=6728 RepID=UPI0037436403